MAGAADTQTPVHWNRGAKPAAAGMSAVINRSVGIEIGAWVVIAQYIVCKGAKTKGIPPSHKILRDTIYRSLRVIFMTFETSDIMVFIQRW